MISLNKPLKPNLELLTNYLNDVNESGWYTNFGPLHQKLTKRLEQYLGVDNLLLVSNGTLALQVAYKTLNVQHALTTPFSFVATTSSLLWQNTPISFSDIDRKSFNLCAKKAADYINQHPSVDTIVATHVYGNPCDVIAFEKLEKNKKINIIYDAAHAFGVKFKGRSILEYGRASTLSFHATKVFHTVEGGAIVFRDKDDYEQAKKLINFGQDIDGKIKDIGINAKLNEYQCAVGLTLLDQIDDALKHRVNLYNAYLKGLTSLVKVPDWLQDSSFNGSYMPIFLKNMVERDDVFKFLKDNGVECRAYFSPSLSQVFKLDSDYDVKNSVDATGRVLCLPLHSYLTLEQVSTIVGLINKKLTIGD